VHPAAHYAMGGVWSDLEGRSTVPGLYVAGEVACSGVHGANRLASNSLLEAVVFGLRAGRAMGAHTKDQHAEAGRAENPIHQPHRSSHTGSQLGILWHRARPGRPGTRAPATGRGRVAAGRTALAGGHRAAEYASGSGVDCLRRTVREESRGAHYRTDFPEKDPAFLRPSRIRGGTWGKPSAALPLALNENARMRSLSLITALLAETSLQAGSPLAVLWTGPGIILASLMIAWGAEATQFFSRAGDRAGRARATATLPEFAVEAVLAGIAKSPTCWPTLRAR